MICIIKLGNVVEGFISIITLGWGKEAASWVAKRFFNKDDCGCEARRIWLNSIIGCKEQTIKLNINEHTIQNRKGNTRWTDTDRPKRIIPR